MGEYPGDTYEGPTLEDAIVDAKMQLDRASASLVRATTPGTSRARVKAGARDAVRTAVKVARVLDAVLRGDGGSDVDDEASPRPWTVDDDELGDVVIWGADKAGKSELVMNVGQVFSRVGETVARDRVNAELIIRAVNAYYEQQDKCAECMKDGMLADASKRAAKSEVDLEDMRRNKCPSGCWKKRTAVIKMRAQMKHLDNELAELRDRAQPACTVCEVLCGDVLIGRDELREMAETALKSMTGKGV